MSRILCPIWTKKNGAVAVSSEKCCKFAGQLRAIVEG